MILDFHNMNFSDEDWKYIIIQYLKEWTEIPLSCTDGYDKNELKFFDGFFGTLLYQAEKGYLDNAFVDSWKYQGELYRVLHRNRTTDKNGKVHFRLPRVQYHRMVSHWTDDYAFNGLLHKLSDEEKYIILEADTGDHFAFDINKFRSMNNQQECFTEKEREFIFPMYKENIKEYHMTIKEFVKMKELEKLEEKVDVQ